MTLSSIKQAIKQEPLEAIGFYTLSDHRAKNVSDESPLWRCELILTDRCNFRCPYCRGLENCLRGDLPIDKAIGIVDYWVSQELKNIRFSGGEPTLYKLLPSLVNRCKNNGVERIAISSNGSASLEIYKELIDCGVNDFSISLDACCSSMANVMSGNKANYQNIISNIEYLSEVTYVTVGIVLTSDNELEVVQIINLAHELGVSDIRIIPAAQISDRLERLNIAHSILDEHPILKYRVDNINKGRNVRGLIATDNRRCPLVLDDMAIALNYHFPCIIYLREGGAPIGKISNNIRMERMFWATTHDTHNDPICLKNCLDVCVDYNNAIQRLQQGILI